MGYSVVGFSDNDLREAFSACGTINEIRVFKQQGYGFVRFSNKEEAAKAIMMMNAKELKGQVLRCSWGRNPTEHNVSCFLLFCKKNLVLFAVFLL